MKRAAIVGIAVAGVVVLAGGGLAWWAVSRGQTAEDAAGAYLRALAAGDLAGVQAMREPLPEAQEELLQEAFLSASAYIAEPRIEDLAEQGDGIVEVHASAELGGARHDIRFDLEGSGSGWTLVGDQAGALTVDAAVGDGVPLDWVLVGDALAPTATPLALLPAEYTVVPAPRGILEGSADVAVGTGEPTTASLSATLASDAAERMQERVDAYADACAQPAAAVPEHCGIVVPWAADLASLERIAFRIEQYPAVAVSADARSFDATGGVLVATAHGVTRDGSTASFTYRADDWALRGTIVLDGERAVLSVR